MQLQRVVVDLWKVFKRITVVQLFMDLWPEQQGPDKWCHLDPGL